MIKGITLICQYTKNLEDHWVCTGSYIVDMYAEEKKMAPCGCKCHDSDKPLAWTGMGHSSDYWSWD